MVASPTRPGVPEFPDRGEYEECDPYGSTARWAPELTTVSMKRYKFTGMERDEEAGLQQKSIPIAYVDQFGVPYPDQGPV